MNNLTKQRDQYVQQLKQVETQLQTQDRETQRLVTQREQLKGAVFALDTLAQAQATESSPEQEPEPKEQQTELMGN